MWFKLNPKGIKFLFLPIFFIFSLYYSTSLILNNLTYEKINIARMPAIRRPCILSK